MRIAVVKLSEIGDRMDAGFHVLWKEHEAATNVLRERMSDDMAAEMARIVLRALPADERRALMPMVRGSAPRNPTMEEYDRIIKEYPHMSLSVLSTRREAARQALEQQKTDIESRIANLDEVMNQVGEP